MVADATLTLWQGTDTLHVKGTIECHDHELIAGGVEDEVESRLVADKALMVTPA